MLSPRPRSIIAIFSAALLGSLFLGTADAQTLPVISHYTPNNTQSTLTITGTGFGVSPHIVRIDNSGATVVSWSNTSITVDLPAQDGPGTLSVVTAPGSTTTVPFSGIERGYYTLSQTGLVTGHGGARTYGDLTTIGATSSPAVELVPTANNGGYWILAANGQVYAFGDATTLGGVDQTITAVSLAVLPSGTGAYVLSSNGTVYALGTAKNLGSPKSPIPAAALALSVNGQGYWILGSHGMVYPYGNARRLTLNTGSAQTSQSSVLPNGSLVRLKGTSPIFLVQGGSLYHISSLALLKDMGHRLGQVRDVASLSSFRLGRPLLVPYPDGTLLKAGRVIYWVRAGVLHPIGAFALVSQGLSGHPVITLPSLQSNWPTGPAIGPKRNYPPPVGSLFRQIHHQSVYIVNHDALDPIASASVFTGMALSWTAVQSVNTLPRLPIGSVISQAVPFMTTDTVWRQSGTNTVYVDQNGLLRAIPTLSLFHSLGYTMRSVHTVASLGSVSKGSALGSSQIPRSAPPAGTSATGLAADLVATPGGRGYWILWQNGTIQSYGTASPLSSPASTNLGTADARSLAVTPDQNGYSLVLSSGAVLTNGDAENVTAASNTVDVAMIAGVPAPPSFMSLAYGEFMPHTQGSYQTMVTNAPALSGIVPTWYYLTQNPRTLAWNLGSPPQGYAQVVTQAHRQGLQVWPMLGSVSVGPFQTPTQIAATVNNIVTAVKNNAYDGVTLDFEPSQTNGLTLAQVSFQYTHFVSQLGLALNRIGKSLMVDVYPFSYPHSPFNFAAIAPYVTAINIMSYGAHDSVTEAGPNQGLSWDLSIYRAALADGVPSNKIVMGLGPYGDYWSFNNAGLDNKATLGQDSYVSDVQAAALLQHNPNIVPVFDSTTGSELFMTNQYLNTKGQWTVNPQGSAQAPTQHLSIAGNHGQYNSQVQNLQGLLNYILVRYAEEHNNTPPHYLNQTGIYNQATANAVSEFQQDFNVSGATPGVYDMPTRQILSQVIRQWNLGEYQYWIGSTQSLQNRIQSVAVADHLAGVAIWRVPFETSRYWSMLESTVSINPSGSAVGSP